LKLYELPNHISFEGMDDFTLNLREDSINSFHNSGFFFFQSLSESKLLFSHQSPFLYESNFYLLLFLLSFEMESCLSLFDCIFPFQDDVQDLLLRVFKILMRFAECLCLSLLQGFYLVLNDNLSLVC